MIKIMSLIFALSLLGGCKSCHKEEEPLANVPKKLMDMKEFEEESSVPALLWKVIESHYRPMALDAGAESAKEGEGHGGGGGKGAETSGEGGEGSGHGESHGGSGHKKPGGLTEEEERLIKKRPPIEPFSYHVYLVEKTKGVLGEQNWDLKFPMGGGYLDYRYFIPESKSGTFFLKVKTDVEMDPKDIKVYYLSNSKIRDLSGAPVGSGCGRYFDITDYWKKSMAGEGLVLNTLGSRHISVTSGTLFIVEPHMGKIRVARLTIKDSRHRDLTCEAEKE